MITMWYLIALIVIVYIAISLYKENLGIGRDVKFRVTNAETGKTLYVGHGNSIGSAAIDGFSKMFESVSISSHEETIESRLNAMTNALDEYRSHMTSNDITQCEQYINKMCNLLAEKHTKRIQAENERLMAKYRKGKKTQNPIIRNTKQRYYQKKNKAIYRWHMNNQKRGT